MRKFVAVALLATGCSFFSRTKNAYYSLETASGTAVTVTGAPLAIESLQLPPGIDRREIVVRKADHTLEVRPNQLWSASLSEMTIHTLAFDLANRLPQGWVILPGQAKPAVARSLYIVFEDFAASPNGEMVLDARWAASHERITVPLTSTQSADVVAAMNAALGMLADRIVANVAAGRL